MKYCHDLNESRWFILAVAICFGILLPDNDVAAKLPVFKCIVLTASAEKAGPGQIAVNYDKRGNFLFGTAHDDSLFFLKIIFEDQKRLMELTRGGLLLYFDPSGKKKKNYCLKMERTEAQRTGLRAMPDANRIEGQRLRQRNSAALIDQFLTKVTWTKNGKPFTFYRNVTKDPIRIDLSMNERNELVYEMRMPLKEIPLAKDQTVFSIGIETVDIGQVGFAGGGPRGGGMEGGVGGSRGGMSGGGMPGGRSGGFSSRGGGIGMGGPDRMGRASDSYTPIKLWFLLEL